MRAPTPEQLRAAFGRTLADVAAPNLRVLFCGINPGLYTAAVGHHFGRPGNRFWPALYAAGFTPRRLAPQEQRELIQWGLGITNLVPRATARADELLPADFKQGARALEDKLNHLRPQWLAVLGLGAYRAAFDRRAALGPQSRPIGPSRVWVLPNPSGLNAHYQLDDLAAQFRALRQAVEQGP